MADGESTLEFPSEIVMVKMQRPPRPQLHFFYQRPDGSIIDVSEQEAALGIKQMGKFRTFTPLGVSNGTAMIEYLKTCGVRAGQQIPYSQAQEIMRKAFEVELESARGHFQAPRLAEWAYPDGSIPLNERAHVQLPTND